VPALWLAMLIASCASGHQSLTTSTSPSGKTAPPITLVDMKGIPAEKAQMLTDFVAEAAGKRDIAIVQGAFSEGYRLDGAFTATPDAGGTILGYQWKLADSAGQTVHSFSGAETAAKSSGDPWAAAEADVLRRIADGTAASLAGRLSELGYAVRTGALDRPQRRLALADTGPKPSGAPHR
jgi:hypothetical protein